MNNALNDIFARKGMNPLLLRIALAGMFLYAAIAATLDPREWVGYLPSFMTAIVDGGLLLKLFSVFELVLAVLLLTGLYVRYTALVAAVTLLSIALANLHLIAISFRDIGLALAALALAFADDPARE